MRSLFIFIFVNFAGTTFLSSGELFESRCHPECSNVVFSHFDPPLYCRLSRIEGIRRSLCVCHSLHVHVDSLLAIVSNYVDWMDNTFPSGSLGRRMCAWHHCHLPNPSTMFRSKLRPFSILRILYKLRCRLHPSNETGFDMGNASQASVVNDNPLSICIKWSRPIYWFHTCLQCYAGMIAVTMLMHWLRNSQDQDCGLHYELRAGWDQRSSGNAVIAITTLFHPQLNSSLPSVPTAVSALVICFLIAYGCLDSLQLLGLVLCYRRVHFPLACPLSCRSNTLLWLMDTPRFARTS